MSHPLGNHALAYRFDGADRSIVISRDTAPSDDLIQLARGTDVLVHEAMYLPRTRARRRSNPQRNDSGSTSSPVTRVPRTRAGSLRRRASSCSYSLNLVPADDPTITDQMWIDAARVHFRGSVIVGKDLLEV